VSGDRLQEIILDERVAPLEASALLLQRQQQSMNGARPREDGSAELAVAG